MSEAYEILYRSEVLERDLPDLPRNLQARVVKAIEERLGSAPDHHGTRLRRSLSGLWKMRVGDYRVVYELSGRMVRIWLIAHRSIVYGEAERRWALST